MGSLEILYKIYLTVSNKLQASQARTPAHQRPQIQFSRLGSLSLLPRPGLLWGMDGRVGGHLGVVMGTMTMMNSSLAKGNRRHCCLVARPPRPRNGQGKESNRTSTTSLTEECILRLLQPPLSYPSLLPPTLHKQRKGG